MKKLLLALPILLSCSVVSAQSVLVTNNGALTSVQSGCIVSIKTSSVHNQGGQIHNAGRITVEGDLINDDTLTGGGGNGIFNIEGDWENNGTFIADQSFVNLNGANQAIEGSSVSSFYDLSLNGSGVKSMNIDAITTNNLDISTFELATGDFRMTVTNPSTNSLDFTTGFVSSTNNGRLVRATNSTNAYMFPVGSSLGTPRYRPVEVTPSANGNNEYGVRMANVDATTEGFDRSINLNICEVNPNFYHQIERVTGSDAADLKFFFDPADGNFSINAHWQNLPQWESMGTPVAGVSGPFNTLTSQGWNNYTLPAFALAAPAPIVSFTGLSNSYCASNSSVSLSGTPVGGSFSGPGITGNSFNPANAGAGSHTITYEYDNGQGCVVAHQEQVLVSAGPDPVITQQGPSEICFGDTVTLSTSNPYQSYSWSPNGETTQSIQVSSSGSYSVTVTDSIGCPGTATNITSILVFPPTFAVITAVGDTLYSTPAVSYQWYYNGAPIPGATNQSHVAQVSGVYQVVIVDEFGCSDESPLVEFSPSGNPDGIGEDHIIKGIALYPNPGSGQFVLDAQFSKHTKIRVELTDMLGQLIKPAKEFYAEELIEAYDLDDVANGVYFVRVIVDDAQHRTIRYIKN